MSHMLQERKQNILVIGNIHSDPSAEAFLEKFLRILFPLCNKIFLISGDLPSWFSGKIQWYKTKSTTDGVSSVLVRLINYTLNQVRVTIGIAKLFRNCEVHVIVFLAPSPIPLFFSKIMGKKIIRYQGGSYSRQTIANEKGIKEYLLTAIFEKLPYNLSDKIIIESKTCLKFQNLEEYAPKVVVAPLYVDTHVFYYKKEIKKRDEKIGYISALNENKGADKFCKSIMMIGDYLRDKKVKVVIGGDGHLFGYIRKMVEMAGLSEIVTLVGWIPHQKLSETLNGLKLLILPSCSEGLPNIVLEAMACGTPVLATSVGGIPDVIKDGDTGFIIENNSPECIAKNVIRVLNHPNLEEITKNARALVEKEFTYEKAVERYRKILATLV